MRESDGMLPPMPSSSEETSDSSEETSELPFRTARIGKEFQAIVPQQVHNVSSSAKPAPASKISDAGSPCLFFLAPPCSALFGGFSFLVLVLRGFLAPQLQSLTIWRHGGINNIRRTAPHLGHHSLRGPWFRRTKG